MDDVGREDLVGLTYDEASELAQSRGWTTRPARPGTMLTMDYREGRLTLHLTEDDIVVDVRQG